MYTENCNSLYSFTQESEGGEEFRRRERDEYRPGGQSSGLSAKEFHQGQEGEEDKEDRETSAIRFIERFEKPKH